MNEAYCGPVVNSIRRAKCRQSCDTTIAIDIYFLFFKVERLTGSKNDKRRNGQLPESQPDHAMKMFLVDFSAS
jgi:hypothetical protein